MELIDIVMPIGQQEGTQSMIAKWLKNAGDTVTQNEPIVEISTDKVVMEVASPGSGLLAEIVKQPNDAVEPGEILGRIQLGAGVSSADTCVATSSGQPTVGRAAAAESDSSASADLSPAVRKLLKEHGLLPAQIIGSGKGGRITTQDVEAHIASKVSVSTQNASSHTVKHTPMRISVADHMAKSLLHTAPHVTSVFEADLGKIIAHRDAHKKEFESKGVKLTYTAYFLEAACKALKTVPEVNSRWHSDRIEIFDDFNIGVATALEKEGLIVPVILKAQKLDLFGLASKLQDLTARARTNALTSEEVQGGTFTISNHGVSGSLFAAPIIIPQPQSAILGIGKLERRVVVEDVNGKEIFIARPKAYVTLTIDHRGLDGFTANAWLSKFVEALGNY